MKDTAENDYVQIKVSGSRCTITTYEERQAAREAKLKAQADDMAGSASKTHRWGQFVKVLVLPETYGWRANGFFRTKQAAEYHAKKVAGWRVYAVAKVEGL